MPVLKVPKKVQPGAVGLPAGEKEAGKRVDFKPNQFVVAIETKGYRIAWSRAARCPCQPINDQTEQPDPNCTLCSGTGWFLFRPNAGVIDQRVVGPLDEIQQALIGNEAVVVKAIMSGLANTYKAYDPIGARLDGMAAVTMRHENKLGYFDRLINLDATIVYNQILEASGAALPTRYIVRQVNLLRSQDTVYVEGTHFTVANGVINWVTGQTPSAGTRVIVHYLTHPVWRVVEHPHALRLTPVKFKTGDVDNPTSLPVQGIAKYEWLI